MRPTKFSFKIKSSNSSGKKQGKEKHQHDTGKSHRQQKLDSTKLQIPARINVFCGWSKPNALFRPSEFTGKPLPFHQRPKKLDPIERKRLIGKKLEVKQKRYGHHVSSPFAEIRDDHGYEKTVKFDSNFFVEPGDSTNGAFVSQRGWVDPNITHQSLSSHIEDGDVSARAQNQLMKYFAAKNDWHRRMIEKSKREKEANEEQTRIKKYKKRNEFTSTGKQCNRWENSLRWSAPSPEDRYDDNGNLPPLQEGMASPKHSKSEKQYLVFPGTNRLVRADFISSYRVNKIWEMRDRMRKEKMREAQRAKASAFAMKRQKELADKKKEDEKKKEEEAMQGVQGFKERREKKKRRRSAIYNREATIRAKLSETFEKMKKHILEAAFEQWLFQCFKMKMQILFTKLANFQQSVALKHWSKYTAYERKVSTLKLLRLQALTQMESASSIREKRIRGALKTLLGNMRLVKVRIAFQKLFKFSKLQNRVGKRLALLPAGNPSSGVRLQDSEKIAKDLDNLEAYFVQYEQLNREKNRQIYRNRKGKLRHEYFDKKALEGDRRFRVESMKPPLMIRWV